MYVKCPLHLYSHLLVESTVNTAISNLILGVLLNGRALVLPLDAGGRLSHVKAVEHEVGLPRDGEGAAKGDDAGAH